MNKFQGKFKNYNNGIVFFFFKKKKILNKPKINYSLSNFIIWLCLDNFNNGPIVAKIAETIQHPITTIINIYGNENVKGI